MPIPKNYISSKISKNFLTPCRRIGLSRSKKTPKNVNANSLTPAPNIAIITPNKNVEESPDVRKRDLELETRNKLPTPKRAKKLISKVPVETVLNNTEDVNSPVNPNEETKTMLNNDKTFEQNKTIMAKNEKNQTLKDSPNQNIAMKNLIADDIYHPVAKRSINFNNIDESCTTSIMKNEKIINSSKIRTVAEKNTPSDNFEENSCKDTVIRKKKCRLRLDSDDFVSNNENLPERKNCLKTIVSLKHSTIEKSHTTVNESNNSITLSKFTTEDYLKEYSSNPKKFEENLGDGHIMTTIKDMEATSSFPNSINIRKIKSNDTMKNPGIISKRNYVAIVCPSIEHSVDSIKPIRSLSTRKSSLEKKQQFLKQSEKLSTASELKQKLTVSLERLTKDDLSSNLKSDTKKDIQLEKLSSTLETESAKFCLKINASNENDDEFFTSSPENDKKQRENLMQLILSMENDVQQKQAKLEKMKQAQVYKKKHSPEKLKVSSDRWLEGCRTSLNDLLIKMQEHGPMEMDTLTKKLRIPDDILEKLKF